MALEAESELNLTPTQKRAAIYEAMDKGLFSDDDGKLTIGAKNKILELLGYASLAVGRDIKELHRAKASNENAKMKTAAAVVKEYDDHDVHLSEHTAFLVAENLSCECERRICEHIKEHRRMKSEK